MVKLIDFISHFEPAFSEYEGTQVKIVVYIVISQKQIKNLERFTLYLTGANVQKILVSFAF
jgi:hypothetical protein